MSTTDDLLGLAIDKNPVDFADTFNQLMMQRAQNAIEAKRVELAQAIYGESEEPVDADDDDGEDEFDADIDLDDDDVDFDDDDLDFDVDDLELDDIDLEDLNDDEDA